MTKKTTLRRAKTSQKQQRIEIESIFCLSYFRRETFINETWRKTKKKQQLF